MSDKLYATSRMNGKRRVISFVPSGDCRDFWNFETNHSNRWGKRTITKKKKKARKHTEWETKKKKKEKKITLTREEAWVTLMAA